MAHYIFAKNPVKNAGFYEFSKTVDVKNSADFTVNIYASSRYILYINGEYVCEGPCRSQEEVRYFDTVSYRLTQGKNTIVAKIMHQTDGFTTVFKTDTPMLICQIKSDTELFETDSSWECFSIENHNLIHREPYFYGLPYCEEIYAPLYKTPLEITENSEFDFSEFGYFNATGVARYTPLKKRPIPMIYPSKEISFKVVKVGDGFIELDAGKYTTAKVCAEIAKNTEMKILYSECYEFENNEKRLRDDTTGFLNGYYDFISTSHEDFKYESYWFRAFRFIRIESENPEKDLKSIKAYRTTYPLEITGKFECSNEYYNKMVDVNENTLLSCMHEIFVDCPYYEQQQYIMDSAIEGNVVTCLSTDTKMLRKCLEEFAVSQKSSGLLHANYPSTYVQIIPGFSLFWIFFLNDYLDYSADTAFAKKHIGTMDKILTYFKSQVEQHGLISTSPYWDYIDWVPGWVWGIPTLRNGEAITVYNLYYAYGLKCAIDICKKTGRLGLASEYEACYESLKEKMNKNCFDNAKGLYRDGNETKSYSAHTIVWAILSEVIPKDKEKELASHLFDKDISRCSFSMNYYLFRALEKCGMYDKTPEILKGWEKMLNMHCTTWCESPDNPRSECHAWSCAPAYEFATNILGVKRNFEDVITIKPTVLGLKYAKGTVPTRHGHVAIDWENSDSGFKISIKSPENIEKHLILPNGEEKIFTENTATFKI